MTFFNQMYKGFMKNLPTNALLIGGTAAYLTAAYLFTHEPYVPMEREVGSTEYIDPISLELSQTFSEFHENVSRLEAKLDTMISFMERKNSVK